MGVDVNAVNKQGSSPMETAVLHNQTGLAKFFMDNQADIVLQNPKNGYTILTAAISMKNVNFVKDILALPQAETLLNMATKSDYPQSPLTLAVNQGQMEILKSILDCMIKKKIVNDGIVNPKMKQVGYSALHYAALEGSVESARLILDYEKNSGKKNKKYVQFMDREDYQGQTPLQTAVVCKWLNVIKFLLEAGSDPNHKDLVGKSAYNLAEESKDEEFKRQFDEICAQTGAPKKVVGGKKRTYQALIQPDVQPIPKQSRPNQVDNRRISVESGIASADSSFSSTCSPSSAPQIQPYLPQFGNWNQPGYDFSQFNSYQNMNYGFGMQGNGQMNSVNGLINTPVAAGTYGNLGLPSLYQNNLNFNSNLFPAMTMNPLYQSPSATTLTPNSQICPQAAYSSPTTLNIPQSSQSPPQAISSHSNSPQVLSPANLVQNPTQNYQSQYPYPSSNYSMNMQMTGSQMNLDQTGHMKSQHTYLSSQMSLNTWSNSNQ
ncbi:unnamed protein product [Bursaphelenchus xylophilus]|nr:unnamed protein product [Bursaphelenchus xylophilus]CAG9124595.1 unnamed protein product [Bursaphelenchus xylophilus]